MDAVRDNPRLCSSKRNGGNPERMQRDRGQGDCGLLTGGQQHIHLAFIRQGHDFLRQLDEIVGHTAHGGDDHNDLVAFAVIFGDPRGHIFDALRISNGRAAVFLDD